jgi:endonuclease YncB( thermonuclease family)
MRPLSSATITGTASVIDGDTIEIHGTRIRLFGIDAPESDQSCTIQGKAWPIGHRAAFALSDKVGRQTVECRPRDKERFGLTVCFVGGADINAWMVAEGWALAYRQYSNDYVDQERTAANSNAGYGDAIRLKRLGSGGAVVLPNAYQQKAGHHPVDPQICAS